VSLDLIKLVIVKLYFILVTFGAKWNQSLIFNFKFLISNFINIFRFGVLQAQIGLAMLLNNFKFETCSKTVNSIEFKRFMPHVLSPIGGINLKVSKI